MSMDHKQVEHHLLAINDVRVGERFRSDIDEQSLRDLMDSIREHDLLHPIVCSRDNVLLAGFRRLTACRRIGWSHIYVRYFDECDEVTAREIEMEENLARANLTWQDEDRLRAEIDRLKRAKYGSHMSGDESSDGWDTRDTAEALGLSQPTISTSITRVEAMEMVPAIANAPTRRAADREIERLIQEIETELNVRARNRARLPDCEALMFGDCVQLMGAMSQECVDLIVTDPPYGIDVSGETANSGHRNPAEYDDDPVAVMAVLRSAFREMRRVLKVNGHAYIFVTSKPLEQGIIIQLLAESGFDVDPIPLVWHKNTHATVDWDFRYAPCYESILFCTNRQRRLTTKGEAILRYDNDPERLHTAQKPTLLLKYLIEQSSAVGEVVFDPFMGSGSTIVAAIASGRRYIGMECGRATFDAAQIRISAVIEHFKGATSTEEVSTDDAVQSTSS